MPQFILRKYVDLKERNFQPNHHNLTAILIPIFLHFFFDLNFEKAYDHYFDHFFYHYFELSTEQLRKEKRKNCFFFYIHLQHSIIQMFRFVT